MRAAGSGLPAAKKAGDELSMGRLTQRLQVHEKTARILRALFE